MPQTNFEVRTTRSFDRQLLNLDKRLGLSDHDITEVIEEIEEAKYLLTELGTLPDEYGYELHELTDSPWTGYMEFHIANNILVVYASFPTRNLIRLIGIFTHDMLRSGKLD